MVLGTSNIRNKAIAIGTAVVIVAGCVVIGRSLFPNSFGKTSPQAYFTVDDGATLFTDNSDHMPPFDHNGQQAVRAHVYTYDGNKTHLVAYLEKYDLDMYKQKNQAIKRGESPAPCNAGPFVKKPGAENTSWFSMTDGPAYADVISILPPPGSSAGFYEVTPEQK